MNKRVFSLCLDAFGLSVRFVLFEKYSLVLMAIWWASAFVLALVFHDIWRGSGLIIAAAAVVVKKHFYGFMAPLKPTLIRLGDRIEFAEDNGESIIQTFKSAKVVRRMRGEDAAKTGLFSEELIPLYSRFYLVELKDKNTVIPYEWIVSIDPEDLQGEF